MGAKHPHSFICQRMQQIDDSYKKIGNANKHEGIGIRNIPCVPHQKKESPGNRN
ncbi:hypothetical protein MTBBW1_1940006 [Desulfamplus magnetovallimortis]|uniref:Uncharacterized protein n=1 Tax=Desulfamplus magnetovallimortis TaxID=1246637 RepID=A0A1W1HB62_9BACT|nr:hypothetical protein MTBBW1_1940006 [Desulfamplus magnetovallimortis]